jgi:exonuclease SbcD
MRILHTSDWHLGRSFGPASLVDDQLAFVDWLLGQVGEQRIDLVVVAGDIYDRAIAPTDAVVMFRDALRRLLDTGAKVAVITGNHDGADRVAAYDDLLDLSGLYLRGGYSRIGEVITLSMSDGPLDLVLLPFLDPQAAPDDLADTTSVPDASSSIEEGALTAAIARRARRTHQSVLEAAIDAVTPHLHSPRSLAVSHAFVAGGEITDSERQLTVGGTGTVDAALFAPFSYTALGHLHRPQTVSGHTTVVYSGTPLAYSFSEEHPKSITIVDMGPDGQCAIDTVTVPVGRGVTTVTGTIDDLLRTTPSAAVTSSFVRAIVTDAGVVLDAKQRLTAVYPHVVEIVLAPPMQPGGVTTAIDRRTMSATEAADAFWLASVGAPPTPPQQHLLHSAIAEAEGRVA